MGMRVLGPQTMRDIALSPTFLWGTSQPQDGLLGQPSSAAVQGDVGSACCCCRQLNLQVQSRSLPWDNTWCGHTTCQKIFPQMKNITDLK